MIASEERARRFARLVNLGQRFDIRITACRCKNPGLASAECQIAGPLDTATGGSQPQGLLDFEQRGTSAQPEPSPPYDDSAV